MAKKRTTQHNEQPPAEQSVGVVLLAFGHSAYYQMAYNLAFSIKYFTEKIPITIYVDDVAKFEKALLTQHRSVFDEVRTNDLIGSDYASIKLNLDRFRAYTHTLYLDVDSVALRDVSPLLASLKSVDYAVHINGTYRLSDGDLFNQMWWATPAQIWDQYKLKDTDVLYSANSSIQWLTDKSTPIFEAAREAYSNPIPVANLRKSWGSGQPDELYLNIALARLRIDPSFPVDSMVFRTKINELPHTLPESYDFMSYFGPQGHTAYYYIQWLDGRLRTMHQNKGQVHHFKISNLLKHKHANKRN